MAKSVTNAVTKRPPVVVVMGHIDHGKSTLLDYIRKTNIVDGEAGGITQHLSAYVVHHKTKEGANERITFLDTPGHAAFQKMRLRGADVADVAILVVSAEDGVKPQTLEALAAIKEAEIPFIVAINKIDKPGADILRTQTSLIEHEIYIEGMGGDIPWAPISAKAGTGISDLLDLVILSADLLDLSGDTSAPATGTVVEGKLDSKRGNTATLIIKNGTLKSGQFVISGTSYAPVRIMEDATGKAIKEASLSEPIGIVGWNTIPKAVVSNIATPTLGTYKKSGLPTIPVLIKADVLGTVEAIEHELSQFTSERITVRVIDSAVGPITANDVQSVSATKDAIIVGFNVKVDREAKDLAERLGVEIDTFSVIYELSDWLNTALKNRTPKMEEKVVTGHAKILKHFSTQKNTHVLGARVEDGVMKLGTSVRVLRREVEVGKGVIKNLQQQKSDVKQVDEGEFGMQVDAKFEIAPGDILEGFETVIT
ncbi:MAG: GTP-binding protein [Candidatus Pacebacteria bacterium]|nr:GTP-binding protein [Candidatus Paceibacterota bacterium]